MFDLKLVKKTIKSSSLYVLYWIKNFCGISSCSQYEVILSNNTIRIEMLYL